MEKMFGPVPSTLIGTIAIIVAVTVGIVYLISRIRANDMKILRDTNQDQGDRISLLEAAVQRLTQEVERLKEQNKTLNDLVVVALKQYFFENPKIADSMKEKILG